MKKYFVFVFLFSFSLISLFSDVLSDTVATVNLIKPEIITSKQLKAEMDAFNSQLAKSGLPAQKITKSQMLDNMISSILILQAAERDSVTVSDSQIQRVIDTQKKNIEAQLKRKIPEDQFKAIVKKQTGLGWNEYVKNIKEQMIKQAYITKKYAKLFKSIKEPTEEEINQKYQDNVTKLVSPEYIRLSMVYISTVNMSEKEKQNARKKLEEAYKKLKNGVLSFDDAVLNYSSEDSMKYRGGDIGFIRRDDKNARAKLGDEFFNKIFNLKVNEISPVLQSNTGFHIVKVTEKHAPKVLTLTDPVAPGKSLTVHDYIKSGIFQEKEQAALQKALKKVVDELKKQADIEIY